jgi:hypothetical protein
MSNFTLKWKNRSFYDLRRDPAVIGELESRGQAILDAANATLPENRGYRMSSFQGARKPQGRWFVQVYTASNHAKRSNAVHNTLLKVMGISAAAVPISDLRNARKRWTTKELTRLQQGGSVEEIAADLGRSVGAVKSKLGR